VERFFREQPIDSGRDANTQNVRATDVLPRSLSLGRKTEPQMINDAGARQYEIEAALLLEQLAEVRACQAYCRYANAVKRVALWHALDGVRPAFEEEGTPALDAFEHRLLGRLAELRARFGIVVH
jgi:hypothetical protein